MRIAPWLAVSFALIATPAFAQEGAPDEAEETEAPSNIVIADLSLGVISLGYERVLGDHLSFQLAAGVYGPWYLRDDVYAAGLELRAFVFLAGNAPYGLYLAPGVRGAYATKTDPDGTRDGYAAAVRMSLGWSFDLNPFVVRLGVGAQYHWLDLAEPREALSDDFEGAYPVVDIFVGYAF